MKMSRLGFLNAIACGARRGFRPSAAMALCALAGAALAQLPGSQQGADIQVGGSAPAGTGPGGQPLPGAAASATVRTGPSAAPHPDTYTWQGDHPDVTDPGANVYYFFYTGTVQADARVSQGEKIERIAIPLNEWEKTKGLIIAKLTNFYQTANNQQPTALADFQRTGGTAAPIAVPVATATPTPTPVPTATPEVVTDLGAGPGQAPAAGQGGIVDLGAGPALGGALFDAKAAAEWTFYYDQLVLWQYYCTRVLLDDQTDQIVEGGQLPTTTQDQSASGAANGNAPTAQGARGANAQTRGAGASGQAATGGRNRTRTGGRGTGGGGNRGGGAAAAPGGSNPSNAPLAATPGDVGRVTASSTGVAQGQATTNGYVDTSVLNAPFGNPLGGGGGAAPGGAAGLGANGQTAIREVFNPDTDFRTPESNQRYRDRFVQAAETHETDVYRSFVNMLNEIDKHALDRQEYDRWVAEHEQKIHEFAENWRRLRDGETVVLDNTLFLITPEKLDSPPLDAINLNKNERLTPQDLIEPDGTIKKPKIQ